MIFAMALPKIKTFLRPAALSATTSSLVVRLIAAFGHHPGRLSASQAAGAIRSQARLVCRTLRGRPIGNREWVAETAPVAARGTAPGIPPGKLNSKGSVS